jgi:DNA-binding MarR family transcriptional regulator
MPAIISNEQYRLWVHLRQTYDLLSSYEAEKFLRSHITYEQYLVLWIIHYFTYVKNDEPFIITNLATILGRDTATVSQLVDRMEKKGLIKKIKNLSDRRAVRLIITDKGKNTFLDNAKPNLLLVNHLLSVYTESELRTLIRLIKKLRKRVKDEFGIAQIKPDPDLNSNENIDNFIKKLSE